MICSTLLVLALLQQPQITVPDQPATATQPDQSQPDDDVSVRLLKIRRIYVETFGDDPVAKQVQAMVVASLTDSKKFIVTENKERADAILKGSGVEKTSQELRSYKDSTSAGVAGGGIDSFGAGGFGATE